MTGNLLLGVSIRLLLLSLIYGALFLLEHPLTPPEAHAPSIWRLSILQWLRSHARVKVVSINQGYYGASSVKPTTLMLTHPPENVESLFQAGRITQILPSGGAIGKDEQGQWKTSKLKAYPWGLCKTIGNVVAAYLLERGSQLHLEEAPSESLESFQALRVCLDYDAPMGPDFHPVVA